MDVFFSYDSSTELVGTGFQAEFRAIKSDLEEPYYGLMLVLLVIVVGSLHKTITLEVIFVQFSFPSTCDTSMIHFKYFSYTINCLCSSSKPILCQCIRFRTFSACNRSIEIDGNVTDGVSLASGRITSPNYPYYPYLAQLVDK
uniref:CUB domain-containing protein n=1 Tax=Meloidogyne floridensis TaxID=298350 RepID=A0A915PD04_9BILA